MSPLLKKLLPGLLIICSGIASILFFTSDTEINTETNSSTLRTTERQQINKIQPQNNFTDVTTDKTLPIQKVNTAEGVNTIFRDKAETQIAWMQRGKDVVIKNTPDADAANFRNIFFHRGAKARPVTCGEVQFRAEGEIISDYQRFIYTGIQSSYLEQNVINFDIFWSIMCEQTLDEYFEK